MNLSPLIKWYRINRRELPWRNTQDPYLIWISEVILQQTRVEQGLPYYQAITHRFPTIQSLADASPDEFLKYWQGLGYYSRAMNLLLAARQIMSDFKGKLPENYEQLLSIKGIGPYTAAAVASIAFHKHHAAVDGNVLRVLARLFAIPLDIATTTGKNQISKLANELILPHDPSDFNQALMETGALLCTPKQPACSECPMATSCQAFLLGKTSSFPIKRKKKTPQLVHLHFFFLQSGRNTWILKRNGQGIWKGLYEPPSMSFTQPVTRQSQVIKEMNKLGIQALALKKAYQCTHQLTHKRLMATFWIVDQPKLSTTLRKQLHKTPIHSLDTFPIHRLFDKFLNSVTLHV